MTKWINRLATPTLSAILFVAVSFPLSAHALSLSAYISDQSTEVSPGDRLYFDVEIKYPENPARRDLRLTYEILEDGKSIANEKVLGAVETQASFLDYIVVPQSIKGGAHELKVTVEDYNALHQEVSASFKVIKGIDQVTVYFFILLGAVVLVGGLVLAQIRFERGSTMTKSRQEGH